METFYKVIDKLKELVILIRDDPVLMLFVTVIGVIVLLVAYRKPIIKIMNILIDKCSVKEKKHIDGSNGYGISGDGNLFLQKKVLDSKVDKLLREAAEHENNKNYGYAIDLYRKATELNSYSVHGYVGLTVVHEKLGDIESSIKNCKFAVNSCEMQLVHKPNDIKLLEAKKSAEDKLHSLEQKRLANRN